MHPVNKAASVIITESLGISLIAKAPYPPFGERRTAKNSVANNGKGFEFGEDEGKLEDSDGGLSTEEDEEEKEEEKEDEDEIDDAWEWDRDMDRI